MKLNTEILYIMDIKLEKKPWYIRYKYYLIAGILFVIFLIYIVILSLGPKKLRIDTDNIQISEVKEDKFMEYVDVEGLVQPILTIKVNTREAGSVERIVGEVYFRWEIQFWFFLIRICYVVLKISMMSGRNK